MLITGQTCISVRTSVLSRYLESFTFLLLWMYLSTNALDVLVLFGGPSSFSVFTPSVLFFVPMPTNVAFTNSFLRGAMCARDTQKEGFGCSHSTGSRLIASNMLIQYKQAKGFSYVRAGIVQNQVSIQEIFLQKTQTKEGKKAFWVRHRTDQDKRKHTG